MRTKCNEQPLLKITNYVSERFINFWNANLFVAYIAVSLRNYARLQGIVSCGNHLLCQQWWHDQNLCCEQSWNWLIFSKYWLLRVWKMTERQQWETLFCLWPATFHVELASPELNDSSGRENWERNEMRCNEKQCNDCDRMWCKAGS